MDEVIDMINKRLTELRRIQKDFAVRSRQEDIWHGIVGQCSKEEHFLVELLRVIEDKQS